MDASPDSRLEKPIDQESLSLLEGTVSNGLASASIGGSSAAAVPLPGSISSSLKDLQINGSNTELSILSRPESILNAATSTSIPPSSSNSSKFSARSANAATNPLSSHERITADNWAGNITPGSSLRHLQSVTDEFEDNHDQKIDDLSAANIAPPAASSDSSQNDQSASTANGRHDSDDRSQAQSDVQSADSSSTSPRANFPPLPSLPPGLGSTYRDSIAYMTRILPQLDIVQQDYCRAPDSGAVFCYDYHENSDMPETGPSFDSSAWTSGRISAQFRALGNITDTTIASRVILVEDLSPTLIDALGETFNIPPGAFAEHLNQSGYSWDSYSHELPTKWNDASTSKLHVCLKWFRPVRQDKVVTGWLRNQEIFLKTKSSSRSTGSDSQSSGASSSRSTDSDSRSSGASSSISTGSDSQSSGASSFSSEKHGAISWTDTHYQQKRKSFIESRRCHNIHATTNIFRKCWPLSMRNTNPDVNDSPTALERQHYSELNPVAWEEKATLLFHQSQTIPITILLLDPLPAMVDEQDVTETLFKGPIIHAAQSRKTTDAQRVQMYRPIYPRHFQSSADDEDTLFESSLADVLQTAAAVSLKMRAEPNPALLVRGIRTDPIVYLIKVLHIDSKALLECLEWILDEISQNSLDDYLLSKHLQDWRKMMNDFSSALPTVGNSLQAFVHFVYQNKPPDEVAWMVSDLDKRVRRSIAKLKEAHNALRSDLAIMESRRSIAEAETVTKLTELAFAFIPLTFASSIFSMQLHELGDGVSVSTFIVTALLIAIFCYGARIVIRSSLITESKRQALETFWASGKLRPGSKIPTRKLLELTAKQLWKNGGPFLGFSIFILVMALTAIPIGFMWKTSDMGVSWNIMITLVLLPLGATVAWVCTSSFVSLSHYANLPLAFRIAMWLSHVKLRHQVEQEGDV